MSDQSNSCPQPLSPAQIEAVLLAAIRGGCSAYAHALGFTHIALPAPDGLKYRLHVWDQPGSADTPQIHNHAFSFWSVVLDGAVEHLPYDVAPAEAPVPPARRLCRVRQEPDWTWLESGPELVVASARQARAYNTGEAYDFSAGAFHASRRCGRQRAVTFLASRKESGFESLVLSPDHQSFSMKRRKTWMSAAAVSDRLHDALKRLSSLTDQGGRPRP
jgi:hypothetical protein